MRALSVPLALALALTPVPGAGSEGWVMARSTHFTVVSDASEKKCRQVAQQFEAFRGVFNSVINAPVDAPRPLIVLAVKDEQGMRALLPRIFKVKGGSRPAGVFFAGGDVHHIVLRLDATTMHPYHVVYHEYVHLLNGISFRRIPVWLDEGMAEFYATTDIDEAEVRVGQMESGHIALLRRGTLMPVERLLAVDRSSPEYNEASRNTLFYAQSAALTHYLLMGDKGAHRKGLGVYLTRLGQGASQAEAQAQGLGNIRKLDREFTSYVQQWQFQGAKAPLHPDPGDVSVRQLSDAEALALRAELLVHTGSRSEARALVDQALKSDPQVALAHRVMGMLHAAAGSRHDALEEYQRAVALAPSDFIAHFRLGITTGAGENDMARREASLERALELQPGYAPAQSALAGILEKRSGRALEAVKHARAAVGLEPNEVSHSLRLVGALRAAGQGAEADQIEAGLVEAAGSDPRALGRIVAAYREGERLADAEALLRKARAAEPGNAGTLSLLAGFLADQKRFDESEAVYREALAVQPENPELLNDLGYMNADRNVRVAEALRLIETALKKQPGNAYYLDSRGWALFRLGRLPEAEGDLRQATRDRPATLMLDHLGDVLAARGATDEAVECWRRALEQEGLEEGLRARLESKIERSKP